MGTLWRLRQLITRFKPDVVHSFLLHANLAARLIGPAARIPRNKLICEIQTVEIEQRWHLLADYLTHGLCGLEIGNSPSVLQHLQSAAGLPAGRSSGSR